MLHCGENIDDPMKLEEMKGWMKKQVMPEPKGSRPANRRGHIRKILVSTVLIPSAILLLCASQMTQPDSTQILMARGDSLYRAGEYQEALATFDSISMIIERKEGKNSKKYLETFSERVNCLIHLSDLGSVDSLVPEFVALGESINFPDSSLGNTLLNMAKLCYDSGHPLLAFRIAGAAADRLVKSIPESIDGFYQAQSLMANLVWGVGNSNDAAKLYDEMARVYLSRGCECSHYYVDAAWNAALAYGEVDSLDAQIRSLRSIVNAEIICDFSMDKRLPYMKIGLAKLLMKRGNYKESEALLPYGDSSDSAFVSLRSLYYRLSVAYLESGDTISAVKAYKKYKELDWPEGSK